MSGRWKEPGTISVMEPWEKRFLKRKGESVPLHFEGLTGMRLYKEALDLLIFEKRFRIMIKSQILIQQK